MTHNNNNMVETKVSGKQLLQHEKEKETQEQQQQQQHHDHKDVLRDEALLQFHKTPLEEVSKGPPRIDTTHKLPPIGKMAYTSKDIDTSESSDSESEREEKEEEEPRKHRFWGTIPKFKKDTRKHPERLDMLSGVVKKVYK